MYAVNTKKPKKVFLFGHIIIKFLGENRDQVLTNQKKSRKLGKKKVNKTFGSYHVSSSTACFARG